MILVKRAQYQGRGTPVNDYQVHTFLIFTNVLDKNLVCFNSNKSGKYAPRCGK